MRSLSVFNHVTLDGYFTDEKSDMSWAHAGSEDEEFSEFTTKNAAAGGTLIFGRRTYELMAGFWPTPMAQQEYPDVANAMNRMQKVVFSREFGEATWANTTLVREDPAPYVTRLKREPGDDLTIFGSGSIVAQLTQARLIDEYQLVINPLVLGSGRTMFAGIDAPVRLELTETRQFRNGKVFLRYKLAS
jgi:dihydrofolate reductase